MSADTVVPVAKPALGGAPKPAKFGSVIGVAPGGVPAHSSHYESAEGPEWEDDENYWGEHEGVYTGYRFQCVEFARRWLVHTNGLTFGDVHMAYEIFRIPEVVKTADGSSIPVERTANGTKGHLPVLGTIILWKPQGYFRHTGHVAIVTHVEDGKVGVAEQNVTDASWEGKHFSRELDLKIDDATGNVTILDHHYDNTVVLGWVTPVPFITDGALGAAAAAAAEAEARKPSEPTQGGEDVD